METGNSGVIGYTETRTNINAMKEYYRAEYKKIDDEQKKNNSALFHNKWKVKLGSFGARVGLSFNRDRKYRAISRTAANVLSFCTQKVMEWKNKHDNKKLEQKKEKLTADFINADGVFKQFDVVNETTIEEINEQEEEKGFHR